MNQPQQHPNPRQQGGPIAGPIASTNPPASPLAEEKSRRIPSGNSGAPQGTTAAAQRPPDTRISASTIRSIAGRLSDRDHRILRSVDEHQFLTARHLEALHFASVAESARSRITRRVLARLRHLRVLDTLDRTIGGVRAGSDGLIYHVGVAGDRLLQPPIRRGRRLRYEPSTRFVAHRLAVADAHVALMTADRTMGRELLDKSAVEPATWRTYTGSGAARHVLKPDLFAETSDGNDDTVRAWFIEIDLGTEHMPTLLAKCREYEAYRQTGIEQDRHGGYPLVVWSITHRDPAKADTRRHALTDAIARDRHLPSALFRIVAPEQLLPLIQRGGTL